MDRSLVLYRSGATAVATLHIKSKPKLMWWQWRWQTLLRDNSITETLDRFKFVHIIAGLVNEYHKTPLSKPEVDLRLGLLPTFVNNKSPTISFGFLFSYIQYLITFCFGNFFSFLLLLPASFLSFRLFLILLASRCFLVFRLAIIICVCCKTLWRSLHSGIFE